MTCLRHNHTNTPTLNGHWEYSLSVYRVNVSRDSTCESSRASELFGYLRAVLYIVRFLSCCNILKRLRLEDAAYPQKFDSERNSLWAWLTLCGMETKLSLFCCSLSTTTTAVLYVMGMYTYMCLRHTGIHAHSSYIILISQICQNLWQ